MVGYMFVNRGGKQHKNMHAIMADLHTTSDRAAAVIGGSLVDVALTEALERLLHRNAKLTKKSFGPSGALGTFSAKIDLGYLTGLYGMKALRELHIIREIRNDFAHDLTILDFNDQSVFDRVKNLIFGERYVKDTADDDKDDTRDPEMAKRPFGQWPMWFGIRGRNEALKTPRGRYLLSVQALVYALMEVDEVRMPSPKF